MTSATAKPNLRNQQRADVVIDIMIEKPDGSQLSCITANLSRTGVMISCNQETVSQLKPRLKIADSGNPTIVKTRFCVPVIATQLVSIVANGHIVHMRRIAKDKFQLGIQFADFEDNGLYYVDTYVRKLLAESPQT